MATSPKFKGDPGKKPSPAGKWRSKGIPRERRAAEMGVSNYDKVSGFLASTLLLLGSFTLLLFLIWLGNQIVIRPPVIPITYAPEELGGGGSGNGQEGMTQELEEPSPEELQLVEPNLTQTLEVLTDVVSTKAVELESLEAASSGFGKGIGTGRGDGRGPGPGGPGTGTMLPDWEVRFQGTTLESYAQQLDFFGIELAVLGGGKATVDYASQLTLKKPVARSTDGKNEQRRYLLWRKGPLAEADRTLLSRAGIDHKGRVILQFVPPNVEQQMKVLEAQHAKGRRLAEIKKTIFAVEGVPGNYKFVVADQIYRF
jgi:hypothetical protein